MKPKHQRLVLFLCGAVMVSVAVGLMLRNMEDYFIYFYSPSDLLNDPPASSQYIRVGGLVKEGSVTIEADATLLFTVTDNKADMMIRYKGIVPSLFREGQGMVAGGYYENGQVRADTILAKHDEYYMPPEVAKSLKESGHWKEQSASYGEE